MKARCHKGPMAGQLVELPDDGSCDETFQVPTPQKVNHTYGRTGWENEIDGDDVPVYCWHPITGAEGGKMGLTEEVYKASCRRLEPDLT